MNYIYMKYAFLKLLALYLHTNYNLLIQYK